MKFLLACCLLLGLPACGPSHGTQSAVATKTLNAVQLPVKSYQEALQVVSARTEGQKLVQENTGNGWSVKFEDEGYEQKGCDCVPADSWQVTAIADGPERAPALQVFYVQCKTGRVFVDGGLEPPVPLEDYEAWLNR